MLNSAFFISQYSLVLYCSKFFS